jgi:uncharacterized protein (DUF934 family)
MTDLLDPDIFTVSETWLTNNIPDKKVANEDRFNLFRKDREHTTGGGVLCLVKKDIWSTQRKDLECKSNRHNEIIAVEIRPTAGERLLLISAYRSQTDPSDIFLANIEEILNRAISDEIYDFLILGDLNYSQIKWTTTDENGLPPHCRDLLSLANRWNLRQLNHNPSRRDGKSILDIVLTNLKYDISEVLSQTYEYRSDHFLLEFDILAKNTRPVSTPRTVYNFRRANTTRIKEEIVNIKLPDTTNVNQLWTSLKCKLTWILNRNIPRIKVKNKHNPPWIDEDVIRTSKSKEQKYKKAKASNHTDDWDAYKTERNRLKNLVTTKYKDYIRNLGSDLTDNPKKFWSLLTSKSKSKSSPERIIVNDVEYTDPSDMANAINNYFCSIFTSWGNKVFPLTNSFSNEHLSNLVITDEEVKKALHDLNPHKAPGPDGIPTKILKDFATELAPKFAKIYNASLLTGVLPREWKHANVVVIHKKGKRTDPTNYRPISLLPVCSKILERCIYNQIIPHIRPHISKFQHGFLAKSSTSTQLISFFNIINNYLDNREEADVIYFDLSKAFDSVPHPPLISKLQSFGINGNLLNWFENYLSERCQRVVLDGKSSLWKKVTSGVPQGSILGPLMFLMYINDLPDELSEGTLCGIFADDTKIARKIETEEDSEILQEDINSLQNWGDSWGLTFNSRKCKHLRVSTSYIPPSTTYYLDEEELETVDEMVDLGTTVRSDLKWSRHITDMCKKAEGRLWLVIRTLGFYSPICAKKAAYIAMIRSILEYNSPVWNPRYKNLLKSIEDIQRKATNYILNNERYDHPHHINYKQRLLTLNLLPTSYRREILDITLLLKSLHGSTNLNLIDQVRFIERSGPQTRQLTAGTKLETTRTNLERSNHFYTQRVVEIWNALPEHIRLALKNTDNSLIIKQHLIPHYKHKLATKFDPENQCTWVSTCRCSRC